MDDLSRTDLGDKDFKVDHNPVPIDGTKVHLWGHKSPITVDNTSYNNFEHDPDLIVEIDIPYNKLDKHKTSAKYKRIHSASCFSGSGTDRSIRTGSARTPVKSRSRPMKPHEPEPFLAVDTVTSSCRMSDTSSARLPQRPSSGRKGRAPTVTGRLYVPDGQSPSPYINSGRNTPASSIYISPTTKQKQKPNVHVKTPFKHSVQVKSESLQERPTSPAQDLKELTAFATFQVGKMLAREPVESKTKAYGRLLKGKLKPLNTVNIKGPTIDKCRGIVSESRGTLPPPNKTLARRREILERIPNVHEYLYDRPRTEESIHRTSRASSVDENRDNILKEGISEHEVETESDPQLYQSDSLPTAPTDSRMTDNAPSGPTPTPRMFVTEINNKGKENTPFDKNIANKIQSKMELQSVNGTADRTPENDRQSSGQDRTERPSTAGKLVRFAEGSKPDVETSKDMKQLQNEKIAEGLRETTVTAEDTLMEIPMKVDITIVEKEDKNKGEETQIGRKTSKQSCKPEDEEIMKKDDSDDDNDDMKNKKDNKFVDEKTASISASKSASQSGSQSGSKKTGQQNGHGKQHSVHMCRNQDRYKAPSSLQIQSVLHDGSVYYTVGAESPRRSPSPSRSSRSPSPSRSASPASSLRQSTVPLNQQESTKSKFNRLVRPSSANLGKKHKRRSSQSSQSSVSMVTNRKSDSSETYGSRKSKVHFEGENPPRQSIFIENKIGSEIEIALKSDKPLSFDDLDEELIAIQESIKVKRERSKVDNLSSNLDFSVNLDTEESELHRQIEEKIMNLELNSKGLQTDEDLSYDTPKDKQQMYADLVEMYRIKCMTVSENCGCISDVLTTPRPTSPARRHSFSQSSKKVSAWRKLGRRNSFHFEKATSADENIPKTDSSDLNKEMSFLRSPSVVSIATDSGCSLGFGADDSKVPSLCLTPGDSDICLTDSEKEEKPLLAIVCDQLPANEAISASNEENKALGEPASIDFQVVAKALEFSKHKPKKPKNKEPVAPFAPLCFTLNARPPTGYLYYFAYGPDMNKSRVSAYLKREIDCRFWGLLFGFQLVFNKKGWDIEAGGFSNIEFNPFCSVEGVIYQITPQELEILDRHVGYPEHYTHLVLPVWMSNSTSPDQYGVAQYCVPAVMYIAQEKWLNKDATLNCDYALQQCIKSSDLVTPDYRDHMVNYCQPIPEQLVCVS